MTFVNIAAYKFVAIAEPAKFQAAIKERCRDLELRGTVLLAPEGINVTLAGQRGAVDSLLDYLRNDHLFCGRFGDLDVKESLSEVQPFKRMVIRITKEIITMRHPTVNPEGSRAPSVSPAKLKDWLDKGCDDDGREVVLLDTRNHYEIEFGTFEKAIDLDIEAFGQFPAAVNATLSLAPSFSDNNTIVSFCTGGIRCEKAALFLKERGLSNVFQLEGGILRYFEEIGGDHWQGDCFVFDDRVAVDPSLRPNEKHSGWRFVRRTRGGEGE